MRSATLRLLVWVGAAGPALASCHEGADSLPGVHVAGAAGIGGAAEPEVAGGGEASGAAGRISVGRAGASGSEGERGPAGAGGSAGADGQGCDAASVGDWEVYLRSSWDPLGYPPYALDGCSLVYVAAGSEPGALHLRDLLNGQDTVLEDAAKVPRRPAISGSVIAWEADGATGSAEVHVRFDGRVEAMSGAFVRAEEPRVARDAVVFTGFLGPGLNDDSDVYLFDVVTRQLTVVASGPGQQRFADVSSTHVAITDFSEDPKGYFNEAGSISDIALIERASGTRTNRPLPGKQAFPLLGDNGVFAYLEWAAVHPEPKLGQFWLKVGNVARPVDEDFNVKTTGQISTNPAYVRPSLRGSSLDFIDQGADGAKLYQVALGTSAPLVATKVEGSLRLFGPVAGDRFTLLASQRSAQIVALLAVSR